MGIKSATHNPSPAPLPPWLTYPADPQVGAFGSGKIERKLYLCPRGGGRGRVRCLQVRQRFWLFMLVLSCSFCLALAEAPPPPSLCASVAAFKTLSNAELLRLGLRCCSARLYSSARCSGCFSLFARNNFITSFTLLRFAFTLISESALAAALQQRQGERERERKGERLRFSNSISLIDRLCNEQR